MMDMKNIYRSKSFIQNIEHTCTIVNLAVHGKDRPNPNRWICILVMPSKIHEHIVRDGNKKWHRMTVDNEFMNKYWFAINPPMAIP